MDVIFLVLFLSSGVLIVGAVAVIGVRVLRDRSRRARFEQRNSGLRARCTDIVRLAEESGAFAMTGSHDRLYLAWTGTPLNLNLAWSPDGREIMGKQQLPFDSYTTVPGLHGATTDVALAPSLAAAGEHLYLAWTGLGPETGDHCVNILADPQNPHGPPIELHEARSDDDPALCSHQGSLILAWKATDQRLPGLKGPFSAARHISILTDPERPHGAPVRLEEAISSYAPALCSHQGSLVLAWMDTHRHISILANPQSPYGEPVRLEEEWSRYMPALCSHQGSLVLAWTTADHHINILTDPENPGSAPIELEEARANGYPALCSYQGSLILAWSGTDRHLSLARLQ